MSGYLIMLHLCQDITGGLFDYVTLVSGYNGGCLIMLHRCQDIMGTV